MSTCPSDSLCRNALYDFLSTLSLDGSILDIGGSKDGRYLSVIKGDHTVTTVNIDEAYGFDLQFNVENPFPLDENSYDHVMSLNLLEHIYNFKNVISESYRVLKPGGTMIHFTPFMIKEHGCPYDYFRYSKSALEKLYTEAGFEIISIEPAVFGALNAAYQCTYFLVPTRFFRKAYRKIVTLKEFLLRKFIKRYRNIAPEFALSYALIAKKPK